MQALPEIAVAQALFNLGKGEVIVILTLVLILAGARKLSGLGRGLRRGVFEFRDAARRLKDSMDGEARDAGRSVGGIYGKRAAQALTPNNQVAELYNPAVFQTKLRPRKRRKGLRSRLRNLRESIGQFLRAAR